MEFGIMVQESPETLEVRALLPTARNKLRNTVVVERRMNFSCVNTDTSKLYKDPKINIKNKAEIDVFFAAISRLGLKIPESGRRFVRVVPAQLIAALLAKVIVPYENVKFNGSNIAEYIEKSAADEAWDILIANGDKESQTFEINGVTINAIERRFDARDTEKIIRVSGNNNRLSEPSMFSVGLNQEQIDEAKAHALLTNSGKPIEKQKDDPAPIANDFLSVSRPPLLIFFPIDLKDISVKDENGKKTTYTDSAKVALKETFKGELLWGLGVGFPGVTKGTYITFRLNLIKRDEQTAENDNSEEDDDSD